MSDKSRAMSFLVHGESKAGKSTFGATAPYPRLLCDVESAYRFLPINAKIWDPRYEPPTPDGTWDTAVVVCRTYDDMRRVFDWLKIGKHPFKSFILDSVSELQVKLQEELVGRGRMDQRTWGDVLTGLTGMLRDIRDLTSHPTNPLEAVVITAMTRDNAEGKKVPYLQGASKEVLPYLWDQVAYIKSEEFSHPDPTQPNFVARRMYIANHPKFACGGRVEHLLPAYLEQSEMNVELLLDRVFGPKGPASNPDVA